jgi:hypothetical protein
MESAPLISPTNLKPVEVSSCADGRKLDADKGQKKKQRNRAEENSREELARTQAQR